MCALRVFVVCAQVLNVKPSVMRRLSRATGARIVNCADHLDKIPPEEVCVRCALCALGVLAVSCVCVCAECVVGVAWRGAAWRGVAMGLLLGWVCSL